MSQTQRINKYSLKEDGVAVTVWDTQGFRMEIGDEDVSLQAMEMEPLGIDLVLYCVRMDSAHMAKIN